MKKRVNKLKARVMTLDQLQSEALRILRLTYKQFRHLPHEEGLSDQEFMEQVLHPFEHKIRADRYIIKRSQGF